LISYFLTILFMQDPKAKLLELVEEIDGLYELIVSGRLAEVVKVVGELSDADIEEVAAMLEAEMGDDEDLEEDDSDVEPVAVAAVDRNNPGPGVTG
jgi:hypothetical protein